MNKPFLIIGAIFGVLALGLIIYACSGVSPVTTPEGPFDEKPFEESKKLIEDLSQNGGSGQKKLKAPEAKDYVPFTKKALKPVITELKSSRISTTSSSGLSWGRDKLWVIDNGEVKGVDPKGGSVGGNVLFSSEGLAGISFDGKFLWAVDAKKIYPVSQTGEVSQSFDSPADTPVGLAYVSGCLFISDGSKKIYKINPKDGKVLSSIPTPSNNTTDLAPFGKYIFVSDGKDKSVYLITEDGFVILSLRLNFPPSGVASDGKYFWVKGEKELKKFRLDKSRKVYLSRKRKATITYHSNGPGYIAIPWNMNRQKIIGSVKVTPAQSKVVEDNWEQPTVAGANSLTVSAEIYNIRYYIWPDKVGSIKKIPQKIRGKYLVDGKKLQINDPEIQEAKKWITRSGEEKNAYQLVQRAYQYATEHIYYAKGGGWPDAPTALKRGKGTCSPIAFVFVALCRASGIPARFQAGTRYRGKDPSTDTEFHRWSEVYLPGYGWVPIDSSGVGKKLTPARRARCLGCVPNIDLIMMLGGGGSNFFGWGYNASRGGRAVWSRIKEEK